MKVLTKTMKYMKHLKQKKNEEPCWILIDGEK